ncbi:hypothetical protein FB45DRAFT_1122231, partial [Roridomyces roridus]
AAGPGCLGYFTRTQNSPVRSGEINDGKIHGFKGKPSIMLALCRWWCMIRRGHRHLSLLHHKTKFGTLSKSEGVDNVGQQPSVEDRTHLQESVSISAPDRLQITSAASMNAHLRLTAGWMRSNEDGPAARAEADRSLEYRHQAKSRVSDPRRTSGQSQRSAAPSQIQIGRRVDETTELRQFKRDIQASSTASLVGRWQARRGVGM